MLFEPTYRLVTARIEKVDEDEAHSVKEEKDDNCVHHPEYLTGQGEGEKTLTLLNTSLSSL